LTGNATTVAALPGRASLFHVGRTFVHPVFDLLVIGGLLTVPLALWASHATPTAKIDAATLFPVIALLCNQAHFAASTIRLYTKPRAREDLPFLTMAFPLLTLLIVTFFVAFADQIGKHLQALYLTWSPYHYAAQTFGLATMYCYRSGCRLDRTEWWGLRAACILPFLYSLLVGAPLGWGLGWFVPYRTLATNPLIYPVMSGAFTVLKWGSLGAPFALFVWIAFRSGRNGSTRPGLPLISLVLMLSNASWWILFVYWDAVAWTTVLHGLQYMGIVSIFYSQDEMLRPGNRHGRAYHVAMLYAACVTLGYALFQCWPRAYMLAGYGAVQSAYMVIAAINIHHFIVDRYIWRIRKDRNYQTVVA
jgi:hypothetical protein